MSKLVVEGIRAGYGSVQVLHDVSIEVNPGETVVLLGTNGNGKSSDAGIIIRSQHVLSDVQSRRQRQDDVDEAQNGCNP